MRNRQSTLESQHCCQEEEEEEEEESEEEGTRPQGISLERLEKKHDGD